MTPQEEAARILKVFSGSQAQAMAQLEGQLNTLYTRAQVLITLASAVVTVTGFSGRIIAGTNAWAAVFIITGLAIVIFSALWVYSSVMRIKWVTTDLTDDAVASIVAMIERRNRKTRAYRWGGAMLFLGLIIYGVAVSIMLSNP